MKMKIIKLKSNQERMEVVEITQITEVLWPFLINYKRKKTKN